MILVGIIYKNIKYLMKRGKIDMNINEEFKLEMLEEKDKEVIENINNYFKENEICSMDFLERFQKMSEPRTLWNHIYRGLHGSR